MLSRVEQLKRLKKEKFDLLVIGGGATGAGIALDAVTRGLKVALVERFDFSSGTSSRSTKLIHGGVRYLEQAVLKFDRSQFKLVRDALHERATLLKIAPHLAKPLPILTPIYHRLEVPYYRTGLKLYDRLAGKKKLHSSFFLSSKEALRRFEFLKSDKLRGAVIYYDGQFDDSRMNVSIALTAFDYGATICNYLEVSKLEIKNKKIVGATLKDKLSNEEFVITAKVVVNAAGPYLDAIRKMEEPNVRPLLKVSIGTHIVLDASYSPRDIGLLIPKTDDGRVLFCLPWKEHTLIGTTDLPSSIQANPKPSAEELEYILKQLQKYYSKPLHKKDILSAWAGLRPLVSNTKAVDTARLSRDHVILLGSCGLVTIAGGKWTTYRKMAEDTVDFIAKKFEFTKRIPPCQTENIFIRGGENFSMSRASSLQKKYSISKEVFHHLYHTYGSRMEEVLKIDSETLLEEGHPYLRAEYEYTKKEELVQSKEDFLARRLRIQFLNESLAKKIATKLS